MLSGESTIQLINLCEFLNNSFSLRLKTLGVGLSWTHHELDSAGRIMSWTQLMNVDTYLVDHLCCSVHCYSTKE